ncbi:MAG TPA: hypothetical protein VHP33_38245 [Polyangiaceae bacterium]|nr:hypothetical protein [Polyangiaceae bacterium]
MLLAACATAQEPGPGEDNGNGGLTPQAGTGTGTGGNAGSGTSPLPTAGTSVVPNGGSASVPTAGTASTPLGGSASSTGGTAAATAGTASTCPPYTGTLAKDSTIFTGGFGKSTTGTWSGYGYTYKYGTATISPGMGNSCFAGAKFCANGSVPADDKSGAGLGWNIGQALGATTTTKVAITKPVVLKFAGVTAGMRAQLSASSTVSYCYTFTDTDITAGSATIPLASFKTECWGTTGTAYDGVVPIEAIQIAVPGSAAGTAKTFDLCVLDVEPG